MKPLDIVKIDSGVVGMVLEGNEKGASIRWFGSEENKCAWWCEGEKGLHVIDNLPYFLAENVRHPFSTNLTNPYKLKK